MVDGTEHSTEEQRVEIDCDTENALEATGVYEVRSGVVLYDSEDPLAWVQADNAVKLTDMA